MAAAIASAALLPATAEAADFREQRSVWMTAYLGDWPTSAITTYNASIHQRNLRTMLDKLKSSGINLIGYHVRSHCDAYYDSKYEPWSKHVSGKRGVAPAFDPLAFIIEEAHERGIEVYAWINPYRYCGVYTNGESELDYEITHPEWLIVQPGKESILNPALEEVQQRICDVIDDIIDKYDIDGVVFDDYFYTSPTPNELDADLYNAAKAADPSVGTQIQWRVQNVNNMIKRVSALIKERRDYLPFGISPAGIASPPHVTSEYGLQPISGEWQYNSIASDPLSWYKNHYIDFMAPQIYWPNRWDEVQTWWNIASRKFGRHLYSAIDISEATKYGSEFSREVEFSRDLLSENENGVSFFRSDTYLNTVFRYEGKGVDFYKFMGEHCFATPALMPVRPWNNVYSPAYITGLKREGDQLTWDAVEGMRYTVYAFKAGEEQRPYNTNLLQVRYTNSYTIPADMADCTFGVAVYDRYGNEYSMSTEGAVFGEAVTPVLTYPADGAKAAPLFDLSWQDTGAENIVEVATDPEFKEMVALKTTSASSLSSYSIGDLEEGKTYYWRVRTHAVNAPAGVSEVRSFEASSMSITGPEGRESSLQPEITWTPAYDGSEYFVEVARDAAFKTIDYTGTTTDTRITVDPGIFFYGYRYYCRVTATRDGHSVTTPVYNFWTANGVPAAPKFVFPATDGATLHANEFITVERPDGASSMMVQVCASADFSTATYRCTLRPGETQTTKGSSIRLATKKLQEGQTYYARAYSRYFTQDNQTAEQDGEPVYITFVYSSTDGVSDVIADGSEVSISNEGILTMPVTGNNVAVYAPDGSCVFSEARAATSVDLSELPSALYIIKVEGPSPATLKWIK